jgi:hypothetical protein
MNASTKINSQLQELETRAIDSAIQSNWEEAIELNKKIIEMKPKDIHAHLRLGFAYIQLQKFNQSLAHYKKVVDIQPQNSIAGEFIKKIHLIKKTDKKDSESRLVLSPEVFVELPGKTKAVSINKLGQKNVLAGLNIGERVTLLIRKRHVEVRTLTNEYIGILPDDVGTRLSYFMENDSTYGAYIQEATLNNIVVFLKESTKGKKVEKMISFPVDIPGSIAKVIQRQNVEDLDEKNPHTHEPKDEALIDDDLDDEDEEEEEEDSLANDLVKEINDEEKNDSDLLGIDTNQEEEDEEE